MTADKFVEMLRGFAAICGDAPPSPEQWKAIRDKLALVVAPVALSSAPSTIDWSKFLKEVQKAGPVPVDLGPTWVPYTPLSWPPGSIICDVPNVTSGGACAGYSTIVCNTTVQ